MARRNRNRLNNEVNTGSMADIAFLLLIFFLVTTTIASDQGILNVLPPPPDKVETQEVELNDRNVLKILVNSADRILVEDKVMRRDQVKELRNMAKEFILNNGRNPELSDSPQIATISFKTDRGSSQEIFIDILNELKGAYNEIYAERLGVSIDQVRNADKNKTPELYDKLKEIQKDEIPYRLSIAEPSKTVGE